MNSLIHQSGVQYSTGNMHMLHMSYCNCNNKTGVLYVVELYKAKLTLCKHVSCVCVRLCEHSSLTVRALPRCIHYSRAMNLPRSFLTRSLRSVDGSSTSPASSASKALASPRAPKKAATFL